MRGLKEILFSAIIGFLSVAALVRLNQELKKQPQIDLPAEPTMIQTTVQDMDVNLNWGLRAIHLNDSTVWPRDVTSPKITVAIIDTGCDINHPDLARSIWTNPGESGLDQDGQNKASNGIDDDDNGFVDDAHGWDFVSNSPAIMDVHGHGTHIAGIIGAKRVDGSSATGIASDVSLMILKYYDAQNSGEANLLHTIQAIRYAVDQGAQIINYSGGGILKSQAEEDALRYARDHHVLVVAAAGNEGLNSDFFHFYPADYDLSNILSVAAVDRQGQMLNLSNYGRSTVDLAAPGRNIYSTLPQGGHGFMSGTSQATAFVTGVAANMMVQNPEMRDPERLIRHLLNRGRHMASLERIGRGQMLDASRALKEDAGLEVTDAN